MKNKRLSIELLAIAIILSILILSGAIIFGNLPTSIASATSIGAIDYDAYTDSDTLLSGTNTIRDYVKSLYRSTVSWNGTKYNVTADDPIVQIVPKSLFATEGEYLHIGKEYGFFVKTKADSYESLTYSTVDPYNKNVEVLVFDITTDTDIYDPQNPDLITVRIEPLFQYRYAYIDYKSKRFFSDNNISPLDSFYLPYSIPEGSTFVVPKPLSTLSTGFDQTWNYFLKDISISSTLLNEQELNDTDNGYVASTDNGYFITQFDYKYEGFVSEVSEEDKVSMGLNAIGMISGALSFVPGPIGEFAGVLGLILSGAQSVESMSIVSGNGTPAVNTSVSNGQATAVNQFTTKADQIENYSSPLSGRPCLTKNATCNVRGDDHHGNVWYRNGDHATAYVRVSHTEDWHTRLEREITLSIVDKKGNTYQPNKSSQYKFLINEPVYKTVDLDKGTQLILLADGDNYFQFKPKHTSDYKFAFEGGNPADVSVKTGNDTGFVNATKEGDVYSYRMLAGVTYKIKVHSANKTVLKMTVSPSLTIPEVGSKAIYMVKYVATQTGAFTLSPTNTNFVISALYHNTGNNTYSKLAHIDRTLECKNVDVVLKKGEIYYFVLINNRTTADSSDIKLTECTSQLSVGTNAGRSFVGGENYRYYKFELSGSRANVNFNFQGANKNNAVEFCAFDSNGNYMMPVEIYYDGFLNLGTLDAGIYYIGVRVANTATLNAVINKDNPLKTWQKLDGAIWTTVSNSQNDLYLTRGNVYYFRFLVDKTVIYDYNLVKSSTNDGVVRGSVNFSIDIKKEAFDNDLVVLEAVKRNSSDENGMAYLEKLRIRPQFSRSELNPLTIDYTNQIKLEMKKIGCVNSMSYAIQSKSATESQMSTLFTETVNSNIDKPVLDMLCNTKATQGKFILQKLTIKSGAKNTGSREITLNIEYNINCMYKNYDSKTSTAYISNELHLYNIRNYTATNKVLTNDIYLNNFANWDIIPSNPSTTTINGQNFTISGMHFDVPTNSNQYYGFIGENRGTVHHLSFVNVSITGKNNDKYGNMRFGTVVAINYGKIKYCNASGKIDVYRRDGAVGGIVAINQKSALVEDCVFGHVGNRDQNYLGNSGDIGGICARNYGEIQFCRVTNATIGGAVDGCERSYGGIVGYMEGGDISCCSITGIYVKITNSSTVRGYNSNMGYIVGNMRSKSSVNHCVINSCDNNFSKLGLVYRKNCFNGPSGCYGACSDSHVYNM